MTRLPSPTAALGILAVFALAGCGQGSVAPPSIADLPQAAQQAALPQTLSSPMVQSCTGSGGVTVIPCHLTLKPSHMNVVTVSDPKHPSELVNSSETDNCNGLVTFTNTMFYGRWNVQAGKKAIKCKAVFSGLNSKGKVIGKAALHVTVT